MRLMKMGGIAGVLLLATAIAAGAAAAQDPAVAPARVPDRAPSILPPPPPPVMTVAAPVPLQVESPEAAATRMRALQAVVTMDIDVTGDGQRLWQGNMRVAGYQSANYNATLSQAPQPCGDEGVERGVGVGASDRLTVSIRRHDWNRNIDSFYVSVSWTHPRAACGAQSGQSTVGFEQGLILRPGETTQLTGDGGLAVKIMRRR